MRFVSVAGCLGYDVLGTCFFISEILSVFQLLVVHNLNNQQLKPHKVCQCRGAWMPAHHNLNNQQLKH
jgi:hypothetical protein